MVNLDYHWRENKGEEERLESKKEEEENIQEQRQGMGDKEIK